MKNFLNLLKKDIKEIITLQLIVPLLVVLVFYSLIGNITQTEIKKYEQPQKILVVDYDKSNTSKQFIENLKASTIPETYKENASNPIQYAESKGINVIVEIPNGFETDLKNFKQPSLKIYSVLKGVSIASLGAKARLESVVKVINETTSNMYIKNFTNVDPNIIKNPILVKEFTVIKGVVTSISPEVVQNLLMSQITLIPIILAFVIIFASQMIANLIASEKENKTLETLMTVPIKRPLIILSKMLASSIMALIISFFYLIGMSNYLRGVSMGEIGNVQSSKILESIGLTFTPIQYFYLGVLLFLTILASLSLASILATFAEDTKTAQMYLTPLMILVMIPYFLTLFTSVDNLSLPIKILVYAIPFSYPFIASQKLLFGNTSIVLIGVVYLLIFSLVSISIATWIISSDRIFTVRVKRKSFNFLKR